MCVFICSSARRHERVRAPFGCVCAHCTENSRPVAYSIVFTIVAYSIVPFGCVCTLHRKQLTSSLQNCVLTHLLALSYHILIPFCYTNMNLVTLALYFCEQNKSYYDFSTGLGFKQELGLYSIYGI